jgi:CheY-like chemotaxis protein
MLAVTDTGTGMHSETLLHIFEPFFTTKERGKGTGLGLASVYGVVKQSNGYIWVDSKPGAGSSFQVYLPRHAGNLVVINRKTDSGEKLGGSESILLVEDAEPLRRLAQTFLDAAGYRVLTAESGEKAMEVVAGYPGTFDLLLTDVVMPGINGRVLAERLFPRQPGMKVLYMSGYTDSFIAGHGVLDPGTNLLHKPFTEEILLRKIREVLDDEKKAVHASRGDLEPAERGTNSTR